MVNKSIIETAATFVKKIPSELNIKKAFLFGSYAKGLETEDSDIDIAVIIGNNEDIFSAQMELMRIRRNIDIRIEPHPIQENEFININPFAFEIQNTGIEIQLNQ